VLTTEGRLFAKAESSAPCRLVEHAFGRIRSEAPGAFPDSESTAAHAGLLENTDPQQLAMFLKNEHPQTIAVVLSNLSAEVAGALLNPFPRRPRPRWHCVWPPSIGSRRGLPKGHRGDWKQAQEYRQISKTDGVRALASLLNHMDADQAEALLTKVQNRTRRWPIPCAASMFVFEDILNIDKEGMPGAGGASSTAKPSPWPSKAPTPRCANTSRSACHSASAKCWPRIWRPWDPCEFAMSKRPKGSDPRSPQLQQAAPSQ